ncbi:MAG: hypothetical protein GVY35_14345 [Bacteroidetes bacterium]|jgi:hypothetical protein|nr:hypothetical protein [Bacteroidota bacterium]
MSSQSLLALALLLLGAAPAAAQSAVPDTASTLQRGERVVLVASPLFTNDNLGHAYEQDLDGLRSRPVVDAPVETRPGGDTRTWLRKQDDAFRLNVEGTAKGMINRPVTVGDRRSVQLVMYQVDSIAALPESTVLPAPENLANDEALLLSEVHYGWSFTVVIVGTTRTLTNGVYADLQRRVEAGTPIEPVLRANDLGAVTSSRGLGFGVRTPLPDPLPLSWDDLQQRFDRADPQPVLAEYTLLRPLRPKPIPFRD